MLGVGREGLLPAAVPACQLSGGRHSRQRAVQLAAQLAARLDGSARCKAPTWRQLSLRVCGLHSGGHKGDPLVLGGHIVGVGTAEHVDVCRGGEGQAGR